MEKNKEEIVIQDKKGRTRGQFVVYNGDPRFFLPLDWDTDDSEIPIDRGDTLVRNECTGSVDRRSIIGITIAGSPILGYHLEILAPRQITDPNPEAPYIKFAEFDAKGQKTVIEYRPGSKIIGGKGSGFYDAFGIILEAHHIGGDPEKGEDWVYRVIGPSDFGKLAPQWVFDANVAFPVSGPSSIMGFGIESSKAIDDLLTTGERELFEYFVTHPDKLDNLSPKQFENLVSAIYKNLGFATESLGAWNQADGGVDIIAVSKTEVDTEFRLAIQCKTSKKKISARPIRELAGVLDAFKAHQGIVATTSRFTTRARSEIEGNLWRITLQDRDDLYRRMVAILLPDLDI